MLPHERGLVEKLKDKPFVLLGINSDESRSALKKIIEKEKITWPNIYQGRPGSEGSISEKWNVQGWPTIYVLDHEGVIRFVNVRDEKMTEAVETLLEKVPK
jgi:hypothetical protein